MSWFGRLLGEFTHASGLFPAPMHDLDLLDEPGGTWPPDPVSRQELRALRSDTEASTLGVDGPAVQGGEASTAGHPNVDWDAIREGIAELRTVLVDALAWLDEIDPTTAGLTKAKVRYDTSINVTNSHNLDELALRRQQAMQPYRPI